MVAICRCCYTPLLPVVKMDRIGQASASRLKDLLLPFLGSVPSLHILGMLTYKVLKRSSFLPCFLPSFLPYWVIGEQIPEGHHTARELRDSDFTTFRELAMHAMESNSSTIPLPSNLALMHLAVTCAFVLPAVG